MTWSQLRRRLPTLLALSALLLAADAVWLALNWPPLTTLARGAVPKSAFMSDYEARAAVDRSLPPLRWRPVPLSRIAGDLRAAVILAEDARFRDHGGLDLAALRDAMRRNMEQRRARFGASTISQQTAKNLFLHAGRTPLRKWHELILTLAMERVWSKDRILEVYLNIAEFGPGLYGAEAAARHYWGTSAAGLTRAQAIELAATLPGPTSGNPSRRSKAFLGRVERIEHHMDRWGHRIR
jgi:monofunctional biosynthetic peptidoglycan transglycosylase